jgi:hypothetical protein
MTYPVSYQSPMPLPPPGGYGDADASHLKALAICHYVWGGLTIALSCIFIVHIVMGLVMLTNPAAFGPPAPATVAPPPATARAALRPPPQPQQQPPAFVGWMFVGMGSCGMLLGWTIGILTIVSGRCIARRRSRVFSLVMAGVNCLSVPVGTTLGVFTFIVLLRPSVQALYQSDAHAAG